jgi:N-formylglutamate amidohydrolase
LPIVISAPHVGTFIPDEIQSQMCRDFTAEQSDTDWLIHELYGFAPELGITLISANYSRYVVDLNRPSEGPPLYQDKRRQTDVIPTTNFDGVGLYPMDWTLSKEEREFRLSHYYHPYHEALRQEIAELKNHFSQVLLFDAHSIRRKVPSLHPDPFPDLIVGDRDGTSAGLGLGNILVQKLQNESLYTVSHNQPFKGGHITRAFGQPQQGIHALQLEMSQDIYLKAQGLEIDFPRALTLQKILKEALLTLGNILVEAGSKK